MTAEGRSDGMIGRIAEQNELNRLYSSAESEFVAIYGRRRVGKTYLVRELFDGRFAFAHTGKSNGGMREQLKHFHNGTAIKLMSTWPRCRSRALILPS